MRRTCAPADNHSGSAWHAGEWALRPGRTARVQIGLAAMAAAGPVVPVPAVIDRVKLAGMTAVLLQRLPAQARAVGRARGSIYARLSTVPGPAPLPPAPAAPAGA